MERPTGVTILAILNFLGAGLYALLAVLFFLIGAGGAASGVLDEMGGGAAAFLLGLGAAVGVILLIFAAIGLAIGIGMWKLRNWARIVTIVLVGLSLLLGVLGLLGSLISFELGSLIFQAIFVALYAWIIWYLFQPHVKQAFGVS